MKFAAIEHHSAEAQASGNDLKTACVCCQCGRTWRQSAVKNAPVRAVRWEFCQVHRTSGSCLPHQPGPDRERLWPCLQQWSLVNPADDKRWRASPERAMNVSDGMGWSGGWKIMFANGHCSANIIFHVPMGEKV
jgi:hypothetical protein